MKTLFEDFIEEFKLLHVEKDTMEKEGIFKLIDDAQKLLLSSSFLPSNDLIEAINKLNQRAKEPMKIAITGQFSSGKSTFLNALLSKDILPTGITPVTSKVNYIRYGDEYALQVKYKDGREAFYGIENIATFVDQRKNVEDIAYLTLFAPLPLLRDIVFVDTPGLNSQSTNDTEETQNVLKEVDGIIWLTLIDNAGKMSEVEVLEEYMNAYQNKSLCVLNQKDKFTKEQIEQTTKYIKEVFKKYFSEVIPISAKQALLSRNKDTKILIEEEFEKELKNFYKDAKHNDFEISKDKIDIFFNNFQNKKGEIIKKSTLEDKDFLKDSNIEAVLEFIYKEIEPISESSRDFAITKDVKNLFLNIILSLERIISIFEELENILISFEKEANTKFEELKKRFAKNLNESFSKIEDIVEKIATEILLHVKRSTRIRYSKKKKSIFQKDDKYTSYMYEAPKINADDVYKKLFYDDDLIGKMFKQYLKSLNIIQEEINKENEKVFKIIENKIKEWQNRYELVRKKEKIESDKQFANVRKFASKTYENILKAYNDEIASSYAKISSEFKYLGSALRFNYQNATEVVVSFLDNKIEKSIKLYEENPTEFSVYEPKLEDIRNRLKISFYMYEIENMMQDKKSFVTKNYERLLQQFVEIKVKRIEVIKESKFEYVKLRNDAISFLQKHMQEDLHVSNKQ